MKDFFIMEPKRPVGPDLPEDEPGTSPGGGGTGSGGSNGGTGGTDGGSDNGGTHSGEDLLPLMPSDGEGGNNRPEKTGMKPIDYKEPVPGGSSDGGSGSGSSGDSGGSGNGGSSEGGSGNDGGSSSGSSGDSGGTGGTDGGETSPENGSSEGGSDSETINDGSSDGPTVPEDSEDLEGGLTDNQEQKPTKPGKPKKDEPLEDDTPTVPPVTTLPPTQGVAPNPQPPTPNTEEGSEEGGTESPLPEDPKEENPPGETPLEGSEEGQTEEGIEQSSQTTTQTSPANQETPQPIVNREPELGFYNPETGKPAEPTKPGIKPSYIQDTKPRLFYQGELENALMNLEVGKENKIFTDIKDNLCLVTSLVNTTSKTYTNRTGKQAKKSDIVDTIYAAGKVGAINKHGNVRDTIKFMGMLNDTLGIEGKWSETRYPGYQPDAGVNIIYKTSRKVNEATFNHFSGCGTSTDTIYDVYDGEYKSLDMLNPQFTCGDGVGPIVETRVYNLGF